MIAADGDVPGFTFTSSLPGVALAVGSTVFRALYWTFNTGKTGDAVAGPFTSFGFSLPLIVATTAWYSGLVVLEGPALAGVVWIGAFEMGLAFVLWLQAPKLSRTTARVGNLISPAPFLALAFIHLFVGEAIHPATFIAPVLIVAGNIIRQWPSHQSPALAAHE